MNGYFNETTKLSIISSQLLGDGNIIGRQLRFEHGDMQKDYVAFKCSIFDNLGFPTRMQSRIMSSQYRTNYTVHCGWVRIPARYTAISVRPDLVRHLDPLGLLLWWCDDGCLSVHQKKNGSVSRFGYLNTQNFTYEEHLDLVRWFLEVFGLDVKIHKDNQRRDGTVVTYYRLYFNATAMRKLIDVVRSYIPYIPSNMLYKFSMGYEVNNRKESENFVANYNFI